MMVLASFSRVGWWEKEQCGIWQNWPAGVLCCLLLFLIGARESLSPGGGSINVVPGMQLLVIICKIRWFWWMKMRQSTYRNNENEMLWWLKKRNYFWQTSLWWVPPLASLDLQAAFPATQIWCHKKREVMEIFDVLLEILFCELKLCSNILLKPASVLEPPPPRSPLPPGWLSSTPKPTSTLLHCCDHCCHCHHL